MKINSPRNLPALGLCCAVALLTGCGMTGGPGAFPGYNPGYPGAYPSVPPGGFPPVSYLPGRGMPPWYGVGRPQFPAFPGNPSVPVVLNPTPNPVPDVPPDTVPTIPVGLPEDAVPDENSLDFWSPWPLPPRGNRSSATAGRQRRRANRATVGRKNPRVLEVSRSRDAGRWSSEWRADDVRQSDLIDGAGPVPSEDLTYHGGRLIRDLYYVNLYVSGDTEWSPSDVEKIDSRLAAAMKDEALNNVLLQYFENQPIRSTPLPSHPLIGYTPKTISRGDIQNMISWLYRRGFLKSFDLQNTVFNLLLPPGTVLTVDDRPAIVVSDVVTDQPSDGSNSVVPPYEEGDSLEGLGGYHGSVVTEDDNRVYYTVCVYSERGANNTTNGIPVFRAPWKNVVATLYHQLAETRTDPDVEEAMRHASEATAEKYLGWVSASGLEIGDVPIRAEIPLDSVFREVPLATGGGVVPIQLLYSNAVHGPEGPISERHPLR